MLISTGMDVSVKSGVHFLHLLFDPPIVGPAHWLPVLLNITCIITVCTCALTHTLDNVFHVLIMLAPPTGSPLPHLSHHPLILPHPTPQMFGTEVVEMLHEMVLSGAIGPELMHGLLLHELSLNVRCWPLQVRPCPFHLQTTPLICILITPQSSISQPRPHTV